MSPLFHSVCIPFISHTISFTIFRKTKIINGTRTCYSVEFRAAFIMHICAAFIPLFNAYYAAICFPPSFVLSPIDIVLWFDYARFVRGNINIWCKQFHHNSGLENAEISLGDGMWAVDVLAVLSYEHLSLVEHQFDSTFSLQ